MEDQTLTYSVVTITKSIRHRCARHKLMSFDFCVTKMKLNFEKKLFPE